MTIDQETMDKITATIASAMLDAVYDSDIQKQLLSKKPANRAVEAVNEVCELVRVSFITFEVCEG